MRPESTYKSVAEHAEHKTPDLFHCCAHLSRLCSPEQPPKTTLEAKNHEKTFDGGRSPLPEGECAAFNARLYGNHDDQAAQLLSASVPPRTFLRREHAHGRFEEPKARGSGHRGPTGVAVDLGVTLTGSSDCSL